MLNTRRKHITTQPAFKLLQSASILLHSTLVRLIRASLCIPKTQAVAHPYFLHLQIPKTVLETNPDFDLQVAEDEHHRI
jgi:hypothetical protein